MNTGAPCGVVINGKFLSAAPTAVHRVAYELTRALGELPHHPDISIAVPPRTRLAWPAPNLPIRAVGHLHGIAWEQLCLPGAARGQLLVSFCNMTPFRVRSGLTMVHDAQVFSTPRSFGQVVRTAPEPDPNNPEQQICKHSNGSTSHSSRGWHWSSSSSGSTHGVSFGGFGHSSGFFGGGG